jgi:hypothetical protein
VAVLIPYQIYQNKNEIKLGLLSDRKYRSGDDFSMTKEELIGG